MTGTKQSLVKNRSVQPDRTFIRTGTGVYRKWCNAYEGSLSPEEVIFAERELRDQQVEEWRESTTREEALEIEDYFARPQDRGQPGIVIWHDPEWHTHVETRPTRDAARHPVIDAPKLAGPRPRRPPILERTVETCRRIGYSSPVKAGKARTWRVRSGKPERRMEYCRECRQWHLVRK